MTGCDCAKLPLLTHHAIEAMVTLIRAASLRFGCASLRHIKPKRA